MPVDMASEQKEILGMVSKRQIMYLAVGGLFLYSYVPFIFKFFLGIGGIAPAIIASIFSALPVLLVVGLFGFKKVEKYNLNRDYYYYIKWTRKTQYGSWRKGN